MSGNALPRHRCIRPAEMLWGRYEAAEKSNVKIDLLRASCQRRVTPDSPGGRQGTKLKLGVSNMICELFALSSCLGLPGH